MGVIVPRFGKQAKRQSAKETGLEYSSEFWLNKYFEKELTLLCHSHRLNVLTRWQVSSKSPNVEVFAMRCYFVPFFPRFFILSRPPPSTLPSTITLHHYPPPSTLPLAFPTHAMLQLIHWNGLYSKHPAKRAFVRRRLYAHYNRFHLELRGVKVANVRYVSS